ncbi:MAG: glucose-6-phosphate isomerase [Saprospiraceae bacterium]|nr:glucose-6-phosphate isomerase [Saprospiraceae bacterium]
MKDLVFDYTRATDFFRMEELAEMAPAAEWAAKRLTSGQGPGSEFTGWIDWPVETDRHEMERILACADRLREKADILVVVGIGGSYLGTKAALSMLEPAFDWLKAAVSRTSPHIIFAGTQLSGTYHQELLKALEGRDFAVNVISKSGTTTEPAVAFRALRRMLEERYGEAGARDRIVATTDSTSGALRKLALEKGYETFVVPDDVGGRFSVLTAVGLLPMAVAGLDIQAMMAGAVRMRERSQLPFGENPALQYAAMRNIFLRKGKEIEIMTYYEPGFQYLAEWWKQLYGESEGKDGKGIFPASAGFTTDLHSMGQYIQDGRRQLFETVLLVEEPPADLTIEEVEGNPDGLNYLAGKTLNYVNAMAAEGTLQAHTEGGVPNLLIRLPEITEAQLGALFYFYEIACGVSGLLLGVNPFDQPGVEAYKKNMFRLLGKP